METARIIERSWIKAAKQDGFTVCLTDVDGADHCFRIHKQVGHELCERVNTHGELVVALRELEAAADDHSTTDADMPSHEDTEARLERALISARAALAKVKP